MYIGKHSVYFTFVYAFLSMVHVENVSSTGWGQQIFIRNVNALSLSKLWRKMAAF